MANEVPRVDEEGRTGAWSNVKRRATDGHSLRATWIVRNVQIAEIEREFEPRDGSAPAGGLYITRLTLLGEAAACEGTLLISGIFKAKLRLFRSEASGREDCVAHWPLRGRWSIGEPMQADLLQGAFAGNLEYDPLTTVLPWTCLAYAARLKIGETLLSGAGTFTTQDQFNGHLFLTFS